MFRYFKINKRIKMTHAFILLFFIDLYSLVLLISDLAKVGVFTKYVCSLAYDNNVVHERPLYLNLNLNLTRGL